MFGGQGRTSDQEGKDMVPRLRRDLRRRGQGPAGTGIVEQDVEAAETRNRLVDGGDDLALVGHVAVGIDHLAGEALLQHRALGVLHVGGEDLRPLRHEQLHGSEADPGRGPGDQRNLALQTSGHGRALPLPVSDVPPVQARVTTTLPWALRLDSWRMASPACSIGNTAETWGLILPAA